MRDEGSLPHDPLGSAAFSFARWRESFITLTLRGACVLGLATAAVSVFDSARQAQFVLVGVYSAAWVLLAIITLFRWPYVVRAGAFLFLLYSLGISGLLENGMRGDARLFFVTLSVMATLLVGPRTGTAVLVFSLLTIAAFAPFAITGRIRLLSKLTPAGDASLWITGGVELLVIGAAILIGLILLLREFRAAQARVGAVVADLTRERARLRESEERYRGIFHRSPISLWEEDITRLRAEIRALRENGVEDLARYLEENPKFVENAIGAISVVEVNDATLRLYGAQSREQLLGPLDRTLEPSSLSSHREQILAIAEGRLLHERESTAKTLHGEVLHVLISSTIPDENDQYQHMLVNVFDISERRKAEAARRVLEEELHRAQKMESIGRVAGSVAHDVNNLLAPILGLAQILLEKTEAGDPRRDDMEQLVGAALRARDLARHLLALGSRQALQMASVDLKEVLSGFMKILRRSIRENVRIDLTVPANLGPVMADAGQIEQVVMNLAVNAQDAMQEGGILNITLAGDDREPNVVLRMSDSGHGMDPATLEHIFEPFFTTKKSGRGTGLGLSTVYGIVTQHGGTIRVDSRPGGGSTFTIQLPRLGAPSGVPRADA